MHFQFLTEKQCSGKNPHCSKLGNFEIFLLYHYFCYIIYSTFLFFNLAKICQYKHKTGVQLSESGLNYKTTNEKILM